MASNVLKAFASQYFPKQYHDEILAEIDSTGKISDETLKKAGISKKSTVEYIKNQVASLSPKQSLDELDQTQLKDIVGLRYPEQAVNEANLTDDALSTRQDIFSKLGNTKGVLDKASVERFYQDKLKAYDVHKGSIDAVAKQLTDQTMSLGHVPSAEELRGGYPGLISPELSKFFDAQDPRDELAGMFKSQIDAPDTSADVSRITDLLSTGTKQAKNEKSLQDYFGGLPDMLSHSRGDYLSAVKDQGQQELEDAVPQDLASLNSRGALFSGDVQDVLSTRVGNVQGNYENTQGQLEAEDNQFYFNSAYQSALKKQLEGQQDFGSFLSGERSRVLNEQNSRFQNNQNQLQTNAQNDMQMRQYNQQLRAQQMQLQRQSDAANRQKRAGMFGAAGSAGGAIAGGLAGWALAPATGGASLALAAAAAGAGAGSTAGGGLAQWIGGK